MKNLLSLSQHQKLFSKLFVLIWLLVLCYSGIDSFHIQTLLGYITCLSFISYYVYKKTNSLIGFSFAYFSMISLPRMVDPMLFFSNYDDKGIITFQAILGQGVLYFILVSLFTLYAHNKVNFRNTFLTFAAVDSIVMLAKFFSGHEPYFLFNNPAIDASFLACCLPMTFSKYKARMPMCLLLITACFITFTSSSILGISTAIFFFFISEYKFKLKYLLIFGLYPIFFGIVGYFTQLNQLWNSSGRAHVWEISFNYWRQAVDTYIGAGTGTFAVYGPTLQVIEAIKNKVAGVDGFFWAHNDWYQILFENGLVGIILALMVFSQAVWRIRYRPMIFSMLLTFGALAFIQMPLRHIIFTVFGAWLLLESLKAPNT